MVLSLQAASADTIDLTSLPEVKAATGAMGITSRQGVEVVDDPENAGQRMLALSGTDKSPSIIFNLPEMFQSDFTVSFTAHSPSGVVGCSFRSPRDSGPAQVFSAAISANGHVVIQGGPQNVKVPKLSAGEPAAFVIAVSPSAKTFTVSINGGTPVESSFPEGFEQIATMGFGWVSKEGYEGQATIRQPVLTTGASSN